MTSSIGKWFVAALLAAGLGMLAAPQSAEAQVAVGYVRPRPILRPFYYQPVVTNYGGVAVAAPATSYYAPATYYPSATAAYYAPTTTYYVPPVRTNYYVPPATTYYAPTYAPVTSYYAPTRVAPVTTYYPPTVVSPSIIVSP
jgi:hypothetical protein